MSAAPSPRPRPGRRRAQAAAPYNVAARPNRNNGQQQAQQAANFNLLGVLPPCPRGAVTLVINSNRPQAAWEIASRPHEASGMTVMNFLFTLTAQNIRDDVTRCGKSIFNIQSTMTSNGIDTLAQLVRRCRDIDSRRGALDFQHIITLIRLSFHCARCVSNETCFVVAST